MLAPGLDRVAEEYAGRMAVAKVNVDENPENAVRFPVRSIPTLLSTRGGEVVHQLSGFVKYEALKRLVEEHLGGSPAEAA